MKKLLPKTIRQLDQAISSHDFDQFEKIVGAMTAYQLVDYSKREDCPKDFAYVLWTVSVTWGFEHMWVNIKRMMPEEVEKLKAENPDLDTTVPDNLTPDKPLSQHHKWAPQDHFSRLKS